MRMDARAFRSPDIRIQTLHCSARRALERQSPVEAVTQGEPLEPLWEYRSFVCYNISVCVLQNREQ